MRIYRVKLWDDTGIPEAMRRWCDDHGKSVNAFVNQAIVEKLRGMDVHSMTVEEIEEVERRYNDGK